MPVSNHKNKIIVRKNTSNFDLEHRSRQIKHLARPVLVVEYLAFHLVIFNYQWFSYLQDVERTKFYLRKTYKCWKNQYGHGITSTRANPKAVFAHFTSKHVLPFGFGEQNRAVVSPSVDQWDQLGNIITNFRPNSSYRESYIDVVRIFS